jgi:YqaJ-like viral recombinase domain
VINAKILAPSSRDEWLEQRRRVVGASEIAALFAALPWMSPFKLSAIKGGLVAEDEENESMRAGRLFEPIAIQYLREERPDWIVHHNALPDLQYFVDAANRIGDTPDAFVQIPGRLGRGIIQIKWVDRTSFRKHWVTEGEITPPIYVAMQASIDCEITKSQYAFVAAFVVDHGIHMHLLEIPLTPGLYAAAAARSLAFWEKVDRGETYAPDFERDSDLIREIYDDAEVGKESDLSGDNEVVELAANDRVLSNIEKETREGRAAIKAKMLFKMKDSEVARFNGAIIATAKTVPRKGYVVKPSSSRQLRFKESQA